MNLVPYSYSCDPLTVNKTKYLKKLIEDPWEYISFTNYEPLDDTSGYILMDTLPENTNYVKILNFNGKDRWYYVVSKEHMNAGILKVVLKEDVLMTFRAEIVKLDAVIERTGSTKKVQSDIDDNRPIKQYMMTSEYTFSKITDDFYFGDPTNPNNYNFIAVLSGRGSV